MPPSPQPPLGGGTNSRALNDPIGQTGRGIPDEAIGPGEPALPESLSLAGDPAAEAIARKLAKEAASWEARRGRREDDAGGGV
jgi:hypothetical protein